MAPDEGAPAEGQAQDQEIGAEPATAAPGVPAAPVAEPVQAGQQISEGVEVAEAPDPGFDIGTWGGLPKYACRKCTFDTLNLESMLEHLISHAGPSPSTPEVLPASGLVDGRGRPIPSEVARQNQLQQEAAEEDARRLAREAGLNG